MSDEAANERLVRAWIEEGWNRANEAAIRKYMHPQCRSHTEYGIELVGPAGLYPYWDALRKAFPDFHMTIDQLLAQGDDVVFRWTATGTHRGQAGPYPAATGRRVKAEGISWTRWRDGLLVEGWDRWNAAELLRSLTPPSV
jgi:steroid delta-isomerase-like uncharacterized protein